MKIIDDNGYTWIYDPKRSRIECLEGLKDFRDQPGFETALEILRSLHYSNPENKSFVKAAFALTSLNDNGYWCETFQDAIGMLVEGGYINGEQLEK